MSIREMEKAPLKCINCGSDDISAGEYDSDADHAWFDVDCNICGAEWREFYKFDYIVVSNNGKPQKKDVKDMTVDEINAEIMAIPRGEMVKDPALLERVKAMIDRRSDLEDKAAGRGKYDPEFLLIADMLNPTNQRMPTSKKRVKSREEADKIAAALDRYLGGHEEFEHMKTGEIVLSSLGYYYYIGPT